MFVSLKLQRRCKAVVCVAFFPGVPRGGGFAFPCLPRTRQEQAIEGTSTLLGG